MKVGIQFGEATTEQNLDWFMQDCQKAQKRIEKLEASLKKEIEFYNDRAKWINENTNKYRLDKITLKITRK